MLNQERDTLRHLASPANSRDSQSLPRAGRLASLLGFQVGFGHPDSGPHAWTESALFAEPSLHACDIFLISPAALGSSSLCVEENKTVPLPPSPACQNHRHEPLPRVYTVLDTEPRPSCLPGKPSTSQVSLTQERDTLHSQGWWDLTGVAA